MAVIPSFITKEQRKLNPFFIPLCITESVENEEPGISNKGKKHAKAQLRELSELIPLATDNAVEALIKKRDDGLLTKDEADKQIEQVKKFDTYLHQYFDDIQMYLYNCLPKSVKDKKKELLNISKEYIDSLNLDYDLKIVSMSGYEYVKLKSQFLEALQFLTHHVTEQIKEQKPPLIEGLFLRIDSENPIYKCGQEIGTFKVTFQIEKKKKPSLMNLY